MNVNDLRATWMRTDPAAVWYAPNGDRLPDAHVDPARPLMCTLLRSRAEPAHRRVVLYLPPFGCTDAHGAIALAKKLLPGVEDVVTVSGDWPDTRYRLLDGGWCSCAAIHQHGCGLEEPGPTLTLIAAFDRRGNHVPLTKTLSGYDDAGRPIIQPHPQSWRCMSETAPVPTLDELRAVLQAARDAGAAVVLGTPDKELNGESRAGRIPGDQPRRVLCLDVDKFPLDGRTPVFALAALLRALGLSDVNCVVQFSATHGIKDPSILKVHLFFLVDAPLPVHAFKHWLAWAKTKVPGLDAESTASGARYIYVAELVNLSGRAIPRYAIERTHHAPCDYVPAERITKRVAQCAPPSPPGMHARKPTPGARTAATLQDFAEQTVRIPSDEYGVWVRVGMALKTDLGDTPEARSLWLAWSRRSAAFDEPAALQKWDALPSNSSVHFGSVVHYAKPLTPPAGESGKTARGGGASGSRRGVPVTGGVWYVPTRCAP